MKNVDIISKVVGRKGEAMASPSKDAAPVNLSGYLLKEVWDKCWEIRKTDQGEEYLFGKLPVGLQFDLSSFVDGGLIDLPTLYDGIPIDHNSLYWEEVTDESGNKSKVLKSAGGGGIASSIHWDKVTNKPSWIGDSKPTYSYSEITEKPDLSDMATKTWVDNNYFSINGGQLHGDLRLRDGTENYGRKLLFGDGEYCYIGELSDDKMTIYGDRGIVIKTDTYSSIKYYIELTTEGIKLNGGLLKYKTTSNGSYWEIEGDVLVTGGITSYE